MVILDAQNVRGAPERVFRRLVERGFSLHVSVISLEEVWAQSVREEEPGLLLRLRKLAKYFGQEPIKSAGVSLVQRLGGSVRGGLFPARSDEALRLRELWRLLTDDPAPLQLIEKTAKLIEEDSETRGRQWLETLIAAAGVPEWDGNRDTEAEQTVVRGVTHRFFETLGPDLSIKHGMHERFQGYYRAAALHAVRAKARVVSGRVAERHMNDAEDMQLLMHIAEGAFLATNDLGLIEHIDASRSFQAPWVRTIGELLTESLPVGLPWGRSARRAASAHAVRNRRVLSELEARVRSNAAG